MQKEIAILLVGLATGAGILHLLNSAQEYEVQIEAANNSQPVMASVAVAANTNSNEIMPVRQNSERAIEDSHAQSQNKSESSQVESQLDLYQATALQLAKVADNGQWALSFQGNYTPEAEATNAKLTNIADALSSQFGSYHTSGCNQNFCGILVEGFPDRQQAEAAMEQMLQGKQLPKFKYYRLVENESGIALRFSIPIDPNYTPTTEDMAAFSDKFKPQSP